MHTKVKGPKEDEGELREETKKDDILLHVGQNIKALIKANRKNCGSGLTWYIAR